MYADDDLLMISALQHFLFCERQCGLIHIEQAWAENVYTIEGELLHARAHSGASERRPGKRTEFGMPIRSLELGLVGRTDAAEYMPDGTVSVVEYKRGRPKKGLMDEVQLCAQAMCIEEMKGMRIERGALFYGKVKRRKQVEFTEELRTLTRETTARLHAFLEAGVTPKPVFDSAKCLRCSLLSACMPKKLSHTSSVARYMSRMLLENTEETEAGE